jgi:UDPglucose--hexose-1-phosphate uridylyltransferase
MPELRTDWLTARSVLIAENRALRPNEFADDAPDSAEQNASQSDTVSANQVCPFCVGNESRTPPAVYEKRDAHGNWLLRVVPNAFPAVNHLSARCAGDDASLGIRDVIRPHVTNELQFESTIAGGHEVIIESPLHVQQMADISPTQLREIVEAYAIRLRHWRDRGSLRYGLVFKNQGPRAGASLTHVHSQLIAIPFVPTSIDAEIRRAVDFFHRNSRCAYCQQVEDVRSQSSRLVFDSDGYIAVCPFASLQPHEMWLMPSEHTASFELASAAALDGLATALHRLLAKLEAVVPHAQYNLLLRTAPWNGDYDSEYHWRIELLPRANSLAGLEMATGVHINPLPPELAASQLRSA